MLHKLKNKHLTRSIIYYLCVILLVLVIKPAIFFENDKLITSVGSKEKKTLLPFPMFISITSIVIFFISYHLS